MATDHQIQVAAASVTAAGGVTAPWWLQWFNEWGQGLLILGGLCLLAIQIYGALFGYPWQKGSEKKAREDLLDD